MNPKKSIIAVLIAAGVSACATATEHAVDSAKLDMVVAARSAEDRERDEARRPVETLRFFGVAPDMTVVEVLPGVDGPGWYTRVLAPYLTPDGALYGENYTVDRFRLIFRDRLTEERAEHIANFTEVFTNGVRDLPNAPERVGGFFEGAPPTELQGTADAILYIRALHHFNRFDASELDVEASRAFELLRPGGVVGVVQHRAPDQNSDAWANGDNGYLRQIARDRGLHRRGLRTRSDL